MIDIPDPPDGTEDGESWQRYQPSWLGVLLIGFGIAGVLGLISYFQTGEPEVLGAAALGGVLLCAYLRWIQPMYRHLWWGDGE